MPINRNNTLWVLIVVDQRRGSCLYFDSIECKIDTAKSNLKQVCEVVLEGMLSWATDGWSFDVAECSWQKDNRSCGPNVLWWARQMVVEDVYNFTSPPAQWQEVTFRELRRDPCVKFVESQTW